MKALCKSFAESGCTNSTIHVVISAMAFCSAYFDSFGGVNSDSLAPSPCLHQRSTGIKGSMASTGRSVYFGSRVQTQHQAVPVDH